MVEFEDQELRKTKHVSCILGNLSIFEHDPWGKRTFQIPVYLAIEDPPVHDAQPPLQDSSTADYSIHVSAAILLEVLIGRLRWFLLGLLRGEISCCARNIQYALHRKERRRTWPILLPTEATAQQRKAR